MVAEAGLRERKKEQTRSLIVETATKLFYRSGFEAVTVAQIARAADLSEPTVFNYFPRKEDLFFAGMVFFEDELLRAVRERTEGESVLAAFCVRVMDGSRRLSEPANADFIVKAADLINRSAALQAHEREIVARYTQRLAALVGDETGGRPDDVEAWGVASALMGVQRALVLHVRTAALAGMRGPRLAASARSEATRAFARLGHGLEGYAPKAPDRYGRISDE